LHNADLYAFIFVFYHAFFNTTNKFGNKTKKYKLNIDLDNNIKFLINKFNNILLNKVRGRSKLINNLDFYLDNIVNKLKRLMNLME
jgi:hypothetical protein